jgi:1-acyl-sn-glycerol-3-phosphate acyltransferase
LYWTLHAFADFLMRLISRCEYVGLENIPRDPPYILVSNHLALFDSPLVLTVCPHVSRAFAAAKHKRNPLFYALLTAMGSVWVRRGEVDRGALEEALAVLQRGEVLGIAPEGTRSPTHALQKAKIGAAYLATRADVPLVPLAITGTEKIKHHLPRLRRAHVRVVVGKPFRLPENGHVRGQKLRQYTNIIMYRIAELLPEEYRGVYA